MCESREKLCQTWQLSWIRYLGFLGKRNAMGLTYLDISKSFDVVLFACLSHKLEIRMSTVKTLEELTE